MNDNSVKSGFRFLKYRVIDSVMHIKGEVGNTFSLNLDLDVAMNSEDNPSVSDLRMKLIVKDSSDNFFVDVLLIGYFEAANCDVEQRQTFMCMNAPAILFPYLRSYISTLTAQAGLSPVIIPTINLVKNGEELLGKLKQEIKS